MSRFTTSAPRDYQAPATSMQRERAEAPWAPEARVWTLDHVVTIVVAFLAVFGITLLALAKGLL